MSKKWIWIFAILVLGAILCPLFYSSMTATEPAVKTVEAVAGENSATLSGVVENDGGKEISQVGFTWGTSRDLHEKETLQVSANEASSFSAVLDGLQEGTTYYYQTYAINDKGTGCGEIKSFVTLEKPNEPPSVSITSPSDHVTVTQGTAVKVAATGQDDRKVETMALYINNTSKLNTEENTLDYDWYTDDAAPGSYEIKVIAWDGEEETEEVISLVIKEKVSLISKPVVVKDDQQSGTTVSRANQPSDRKYSKLSKIQGSYGSFWYRDTSGGRIEIDPKWVRENIVTITLPGLNQKVQVHKDAADNFIQAFTYIKNGTATINGKTVPLLSLIKTMDGTFVTRHVMWNASRGLSRHSWGIAIDINADDHLRYINPSKEPNDPNLILWEKAFKPAGFSWGNRYSDSMHFELMD